MLGTTCFEPICVTCEEHKLSTFFVYFVNGKMTKNLPFISVKEIVGFYVLSDL